MEHSMIQKPGSLSNPAPQPPPASPADVVDATPEAAEYRSDWNADENQDDKPTKPAMPADR